MNQIGEAEHWETIERFRNYSTNGRETKFITINLEQGNFENPFANNNNNNNKKKKI